MTMAVVDDDLRLELIATLGALLAEYSGAGYTVPGLSSARANDAVHAALILAKVYDAEARDAAVEAVREAGGDSEALYKAENSQYLLETALVNARLAVQPSDSRDAGIIMQVAESLAQRYLALTGRQLHDDLQLWMEGR